ncbi:GMC oxidoreductase [Mesorhizobium australicum]|uniref:GMC oxidoreductase n=1 Tax=Mesorhizobium australicum TaxID=536018 RepID=UPI003EBEAC71
MMPLQRETGWHILGFVRMGDDPRNSVVDSFGRSHDVPNLFVMDGMRISGDREHGFHRIVSTDFTGS